MEQPSKLLLKLAHRLFDNPDEEAKFIAALVHPQPFSPSILWCQNSPATSPFTMEIPTPWQPQFVDRLQVGERPGQHALHQAGAFYCLDFSSIFAASVLLTIQQPVPLVLDLCAAPGGKSIFAWKALQPDLIVSNEVIGKRIGMLVSNLKRCQIEPVCVLNRDTSVLAQMLKQSMSLVIVDAPCSGQSLLAKRQKAPGCFHQTVINKNANRQKRIIANSAGTVAPQGYLVYMTCTYSPEENEQVCTWFLERFPQFKPVEVSPLSPYKSNLTTIPCYRMFPQEGLGAGAFTVLFKNMTEGNPTQLIGDEILSAGVWYKNSSMSGSHNFL